MCGAGPIAKQKQHRGGGGYGCVHEIVAFIRIVEHAWLEIPCRGDQAKTSSLGPAASSPSYGWQWLAYFAAYFWKIAVLLTLRMPVKVAGAGVSLPTGTSFCEYVKWEHVSISAGKNGRSNCVFWPKFPLVLLALHAPGEGKGARLTPVGR